jgi:translocation and assembly module TamB
MIALVLAALLAAIPLAARAQDDAADTAGPRDGRSFLEGVLEDALSAPERRVRVIGFEGALSSHATVETITFSDPEGTWLTIKEAELEWSRTALLGGRLDVTALSAKSITLTRPPLPAAPTPPDPQARAPFALPELPVSVKIGELSADKVTLGKAVLGQRAVVALKAALSLEGGTGQANLSLKRIDGREGVLRLDAAYSNDDRVLSLDLDAHEAAGGIAATLLNIPGQPAAALSAKGTGPISDYTAQITLATSGQERLAGTLTLGGDKQAQTATDAAGPVPQAFALDIGGDIAPLFAPDYRAFFGPDITLRVAGAHHGDGAFTLDRLALHARAISLRGAGRIAADGWPERLALTGQITAPDGAPVLLPLAGPRTTIEGAKISLDFDVDRNDRLDAEISAHGIDRPDLSLAQATLTATGLLRRGLQSTPGLAEVDLKARLSGLAPSDPALARALGPDLRATARADWSPGSPLRLTGLALAGSDYELSGDMTLRGVEGTVDLSADTDLRAQAQDLSRFDALVGRPLRGRADIALRGTIQPVSGGFDLTLDGETRDIAIGDATLDPLLRGTTTLSVDALRDTDGTTLEALEMSNPALRLDGHAHLGAARGQAQLSARLSDLGLLADGFRGPASATITADHTGGPWSLTVDATGPGGTQMRAEGTAAQDASRADLAITGQAPLALANAQIRPRRLSGTARFDLRLDGAPGLAALSGTVSTEGARLTLPNLRLALGRIDGQARLAQGRANLDVTSALSSGGRVRLSGPVTLGPPFDADLALDLRRAKISEPGLFRTTADGNLTIRGPLAGGARIGGQITLGEVEMRVPETSGPSYGDLPGLRHVGEPADVHRTRVRAGIAGNAGASPRAAGPAYPVDLLIRAPARIFVRGRGMDAELGGQIRLTGTTADLIPQGQFNLIRGRLEILGRRLELSQGLISLRGAFDPFIRFTAQSRVDSTDVRIGISGPASSPDLDLTSRPELPRDEVLSLLLFGRGVTDISPLQALRLANALRTLSGQGGAGVSERLRSGAGLDNLDLTTDANGQAQARAGKYISENIYTNVVVDTQGRTEININLDVSPNITVRGRLGSEGDTGLGVFLERDY